MFARKQQHHSQVALLYLAISLELRQDPSQYILIAITKTECKAARAK